MRGIPEYNYPALHAAATALREAGWFVYSPAEMDAPDPEDWASIPVEDQKLHDNAINARRFARRDIDVLLNKLHVENGDAVVVLPGFEQSVGAQAETAVAKWVYLPILTLTEALDDSSCRRD